jgi:hypothetical protein
LDVAISSTPAEERDLGNGKFEIVVDSQNEGGSWKTTVPALAVDQPIQLPNVAVAKLIAIRTNPKNPNDASVPLTFKRGSALGEAIVVAALTTSKEGYFFYTTDSLTALFCSNPGSVSMDVTIYVCGD